MAKQSPSFRVGKVLAYRRGRVCYLCYHEHGARHRPRVGPTARPHANSPPRSTLNSKSAPPPP
jgi:hypothetical protein